MYTVGSLFAGIGGICLGFEQAGAKVIWANEIDKNACLTYKTNFKDVNLIQGDIMKLDAKTLPKVDILVAGFPCQPFSIAGFQKGFDDDRGNLFFEVLRFIKDIKPKAFLLENVKNLASHDKGNTLKVIKKHLENEGYIINYKIMNTSEFGNIPQNRERIYIVGFNKEESFSKFDFPKKIKLEKTILDIIDIDEQQDKKYYYNNCKCYDELKENMKSSDTLYQWRRVYVRENKNKLCPTLTANMGTGRT